MAARLGGAAEQEATPGASQSGRLLLELRTYRFKSPDKQEAYERFLKDAAVPAFNQAGVEPVGVFKPTAKDNPDLKLPADPTDLYVLLPHKSWDSVLGLESRLAADKAFQKAGESVLATPKSDPAYTRFDSTLLLAFQGSPTVKAPPKSSDRLFELRTYQSHDEERARNKVEMFNKGEFPVFDRAGMPGVFFGSAVVGSALPQLTYMIVHEDPQDVKKHWGAFFADPAWKQLSGNPSYKDNVSKVIDLFLRPSAGSQV